MIRITIEATPEDLKAWARRPGNSWPASELARLEEPIRLVFAGGDLVEASEVLESVPVHEADAFASDAAASVFGHDGYALVDRYEDDNHLPGGAMAAFLGV